MEPVIYGIGIPLLLYFFFQVRKPISAIEIDKVRDEAISPLEMYFVYIPLGIYLLGQGTSLLSRSLYLQTNGFGFITRLSGVTNFVSFGILSFIILTKTRWKKITILLPLTLWYLFLLSSGSRSSLIPLGILIVFFMKSISNFIVKTVVITSILILFSYTFQIILISRSQKIGLINLPTNANHVVFHYEEFFGSGVNSFAAFLGGLLVVVLIVPLSVGSANYHTILADANPLISNISSQSYSAGSNGVERLLPYEWVPTSTVGTLYGVWGFFGIFVIIFSLTGLYILTLNFRTSKSKVLFFMMADTLYYVQFAFFLEYSARIWFRIFWAILLSILAGTLSSSANAPHKYYTKESTQIDSI
jgi:hypothetical protein